MRLDARWLNFWARGQGWYGFWQDGGQAAAPAPSPSGRLPIRRRIPEPRDPEEEAAMLALLD